MTEYKCSICNYSSSKYNVNRHIIKENRCGEGDRKLVEIFSLDENKCEYCKKIFSTKPILSHHNKICKVKKLQVEEENHIIKEKLAISEMVSEDIDNINKKYENLLKINEDLLKINEKNEKIIDSILKTSTKKILGNTPVETIRSQARKKYKELFKDMKCVHCKHNGSTQVCHIKAISDFDKFSEIEEINKMSNLIGLCPNCHMDLDKHKKFEVTRTAMLHSMLINC